MNMKGRMRVRSQCLNQRPSGANLYVSFLSGAEMEYSDLSGADLREAWDWESAYFDYATYVLEVTH